MQFFDGKLHNGSEYLLLGCAEEGGLLHVLDDAFDFAEAKEKAQLFLDDNPNGGILIERHICAVYRLPIFNQKES